MNFDSYKASNLNVASPRDNQDKFTILNDGANALIKENANLGKTIMAGANMLIQQNENVKAIDANNYYNKLVSDGMMKIQSKKEGEALNSVEDFKTMEQKAYEETRRKYGKYLYGRTGSIFEQARSKDANARRQQVEKYQMQEKEKYDDTTLTNSLMQSYIDMGNNLNDDVVLKNGFGKIEQMVAGRFSANGAERIIAEQRKWRNKIAMGLARSAIDSNDFATANRILNMYGDKLTPDERGPLSKAISGRLKQDDELTRMEQAWIASGGDLQKFNTLCEGFATFSGGNISKAVDIARGMIGTNPKDINGITLGKLNTCTLLVREVLRQSGMDAGKDGDNWAPTMLANAQEEKRTFNDAGQLQHGDIVFWETNKNWDDGTDHVGIYDATTGKVIQSGTSGIKAIGLNDYEIHSFAHPKVNERAMTPSEKAEFNKRRDAFAQNKMHEKNMILSDKKEQCKNQLQDLYLAGNLTQESAERIALSNSYNVDGTLNVDAYRINSMLAKSMTKENGKTSAYEGLAGDSSNGSVLSPIVEDEMVLNLINGNYTPEKLLADAQANGSKKVVSAAIKAINEYEQNKGDYKQKFEGLESAVMGKYNAPDKKWVYKNLEPKIYSWYRACQSGALDGQKRTPTPEEVVQYGQSLLVKDISSGGFMSKKFSVSDLLLGGDSNVTNIIKWGDDNAGGRRWRVSVNGWPTPVLFGEDDMLRLSKGEKAIDIIRGWNR